MGSTDGVNGDVVYHQWGHPADRTDGARDIQKTSSSLSGTEELYNSRNIEPVFEFFPDIYS